MLGIDSIRFVAALWVVLGHLPRIELTAPEQRRHFGWWVLQAATNNAFNGQAAVIVFFVISGFCIHYPFRTSPPSTVPFLARRIIRIVGPMAVALLLWRLAGLPPPGLGGAVFWSLFCELIYYCLYPALRGLSGRASWGLLTLASVVPAAVVALKLTTYGDYGDSGPSFTWLLGLPAWLLGCLVANASPPAFRLTALLLATLRTSILGLSVLASVLRFHSPVKYPASLNLFSLSVAFWLWCEIAWSRSRKPLALLERAGAWSYSVYLVHVPVLHFLSQQHVVPEPWWLRVPTSVGLVLIASWIFGRVVERPFHILAREAAVRLSTTRPATKLAG